MAAFYHQIAGNQIRKTMGKENRTNGKRKLCSNCETIP